MVKHETSKLAHLLHELLVALPGIEDRLGEEGVKRHCKLIRHYQRQHDKLADLRKWPPVA
ncbi:MAG TPA: hypothetical protein DD979_13525 [Gammaproteobacteria bacterium]|jgi:AAA+ superfamily predicted ATPase|nr:hypothetical protein [Gammaproteobacteria bacterium]